MYFIAEMNYFSILKIIFQSKPLMVWCTSGTTVLNAFDPLLNISQVCAKYKIWMHVDACLGGCVLVSEKHRHLLNGIEQYDRISKQFRW